MPNEYARGTRAMQSIAISMVRGTLRAVRSERGDRSVAFELLKQLEADLAAYVPPESALQTEEAKKFGLVAADSDRSCEFCGRHRRAVTRMVGTATAAICERCVQVAAGLL